LLRLSRQTEEGFIAARPDGFLASGKPYVVEMDVIIFETDLPSMALAGRGGPNYKEIWKTTLRSTPKEINIPDVIRRYMDATPKPQATPPAAR
jgi:hypothetical protein